MLLVRAVAFKIRVILLDLVIWVFLAFFLVAVALVCQCRSQASSWRDPSKLTSHESRRLPPTGLTSQLSDCFSDFSP